MSRRGGGVNKAARYPIFIAGLFVMIVGGLAGWALGLGTGAEAALAAIGFFLVVTSLALR